MMNSNNHNSVYSEKIHKLILVFALMATLIVTGGCLHKETGALEEVEGNSELTISLTDLPGEFSSYTVDVESIELTKESGTIVEAVPVSTRVDFSQYVDMTEFLTAATIPVGKYVKVKMRLNYLNSDIQVESPGGDIVPVTTIVDEQGNAIDTLEMSVSLLGRDELVITPGVPSHLTLDFDLKSSNQVEFDSDVRLTVSPLLVADLEIDPHKVHRLRGALANVNVDQDRFRVILRPFYQRIRNHNERRFGAIPVEVTETTQYDINGIAYEGKAGLEAMNGEPAFSAVIVMGDLNLKPRRFVAREVIVGSGVPGGTLDGARGTVLSRSGNEIVLRGATLIRADGAIAFHKDLTVNLADTTFVRKQLSSETVTIDDISVGQRLGVMGVVSNDGTGFAMDASNGSAYMILSSVSGTVNSLPSIPDGKPYMELNAQKINGRRVSVYDFSGTGIDAGNDAIPSSYEVEVSGLPLESVSAGSVVRARGFVKSFAQAPADFIARTVVNLDYAPARLAVNWPYGSPDALSVDENNRILLNFASTGKFHHVVRSGVVTDLMDQGSGERAASLGSLSQAGIFILRKNGVNKFYFQYDTFVTLLAQELAAGEKIRLVQSSGQYLQNDLLFKCTRLLIVI
ncbi:MAG: DUF4382 domain-containing protein [Gammaproteobacteria bacterium]|nr:DUF4382 domain-containing protein [Gammaproteobacteria bacterium]